VVVEQTDARGRLVRLAVSSGAALLEALYAEGRVVAYAYLEEDPELWDVQTVFASRPWASEMPSAGRPISFALLGALRRRGVEVVRLTHGAGLSSTGRPELDRKLPLTESFEIEPTVGRAVLATRARGGRVVAVGTTTVRALESAARGRGGLGGARAATSLVLGPDTRPLVVDAVVTGMHEPETSHYQLLRAFAPDRALRAACEKGEREGYLLHELGDSLIVLPPRRRRDRAA
jgi:S-adenosylmethionine:tRNA ribosyltransferase-isomerase